MLREMFLKAHEAIRNRMGETTIAKNSDYSGDSNDAFQNFKLVEALGIANVPTAIMVRMSDKMARISSYLQQGSLKVKDESVMDSCVDLANYAVILAIYFQHQKDTNNEQRPKDSITNGSGSAARPSSVQPSILTDPDWVKRVAKAKEELQLASPDGPTYPFAGTFDPNYL